MEEVLRAAATGVLAALLVLTLKKDNPSGAYLVTIGAGVVIIWGAVTVLSPIKNLLDELREAAGLSPETLKPLYKVLGIAVVTKMSAETCNDAGEDAIGTYIELAGGAAALYASLPLFSAAFATIRSLLSI